MNDEQFKQRVADDLLNGATEIADFLGTSRREVYHLVQTGRIPVGRWGKKLIGSRRQLSKATKKATSPQKITSPA